MRTRYQQLSVVASMLVLSVIVIISTAIAFDRYFFSPDKISGRLIKTVCDSSGIIYADYGHYEHLIETIEGRYEKRTVPKSLCEVPGVGSDVEYSVGTLTSIVVFAEINSDGTWSILRWYHFLAIAVMLLGYQVIQKQAMPPMKIFLFLVTFAMFRFLVASI